MHIYAKTPTLITCPKCGKPTLSHVACPSCGFYKGMEVIDVLKKLDKKERKLKEKEMATQEKTKEKEKAEALTMEGLSKEK